MLTDEDIIQGCKKGDRRAQEELFLRYGKKMYGYCLRYSGNPADANDLLQDGFVKVFEFIGTYKGDSAIEAWMTRLFINLAISRFRKRSTGPQFVEVDTIPLAEQVEENESAQESLSESVDEVLSALAALPEKYRLVINLYAIDNMSHREIAEQLGISEGGSKSLLSRGRVMLKELMKNKKKR
ncbi:MAG: RNA polymerase sigma factor [Sphingomonadales bacterium]